MNALNRKQFFIGLCILILGVVSATQLMTSSSLAENDTNAGIILMVASLILGILLFLRFSNCGFGVLKYVLTAVGVVPPLTLGLITASVHSEDALIGIVPFMLLPAALLVVIVALVKKSALAA